MHCLGWDEAPSLSSPPDIGTLETRSYPIGHGGGRDGFSNRHFNIRSIYADAMVQGSTFDFSNVDRFREYESESCDFVSSIIAEFSPDCIVLVHRKGERIFRDLFFHHSGIVTSGAVVISDDEIHSSDSCRGRVLILDDSIRVGESVGAAVDGVRSGSPGATVMVAALVSNDSTVENLRREKSVDAKVMHLYQSREEQAQDMTIFYLTYGAGVKFGTGYPAIEMETDCLDHSVVSDIVDELVLGLFGNFESEVEKNRFRDAEKHIYHLTSVMNDGLCTSDQKVFLFTDNGPTSQRIRVEVLINPPSASIGELQDAVQVSQYILEMHSGNLDRICEGLSRGLNGRGYSAVKIRKRAPSESVRRRSRGRLRVQSRSSQSVTRPRRICGTCEPSCPRCSCSILR